ALRKIDPALVSDPRRRSVFEGPGAPERPAPPSALDRSSPNIAGAIARLTRNFQGDRELEIGADDLPLIIANIEARLPARGGCEIRSENAQGRLVPAKVSSFAVEDQTLTAQLAPDAVSALLAALKAGVGPAVELPGLPGLKIRVTER